MSEINYENISKNTILYGPPGTGKTYNTVNYAVAICDPNFKPKDREDLKKRFDQLKKEDRIEFVTFHQSYSYEDFVEGIRPKLPHSPGEGKPGEGKPGEGKPGEGEPGETQLEYEYHIGIFKEICDRARVAKPIPAETNTFYKILEQLSYKNHNIWLVSAASYDKDNFINNSLYGLSKIGHPENKTQINNLQKDDIIIMVQGRKGTKVIFAIGTISSDETKENDKWYYKQTHWVPGSNLFSTFTDQNPIGNDQMTLNVTQKIINSIDEIKKEGEPSPNSVKPNYVLIIDEINRGNISKIFGELITLIEESKREGQSEEIKVKLPYTQKEFGVPDNLYILGTMNTADRSLTMMDAALRRRFEFVEMPPKPELLTDITIYNSNKDKGGDFNLSDLLTNINKRIEFLCDSEHMIGHSFFMSLKGKDKPTEKDLEPIFRKSIIPLLKEYFFDDYQKIKQVLSKDFVEENKLTDYFDEDTKKDLNQSTRYQINEKSLSNFEAYNSLIVKNKKS